MKMTRRISHTLGGALADRMMRIKRSTPVDQEIAAADLALSSLPVAVGISPNLVSLARGYYRGHRAVIHSALAGLLLVALAGWARHRRLI